MTNRDKILFLCLYSLSGITHGLHLGSNAFVENGLIPPAYTCNGANTTPPLHWSDAPAETQTLVLICDDPDAPNGTWDHWLLYNIPATVAALSDTLPEGTQSGLNSWMKTGYGGPCPPTGEHHYHFKLYALKTKLNFDTPPTKTILEAALQPHILASTTLIARYSQPGSLKH